jgi:hypothetical protein
MAGVSPMGSPNPTELNNKLATNRFVCCSFKDSTATNAMTSKSVDRIMIVELPDCLRKGVIFKIYKNALFAAKLRPTEGPLAGQNCINIGLFKQLRVLVYKVFK